MSRGNHKTGSRNKPGTWVSTNRGRANKNRYERGTVMCPHGHHLVPSRSFLVHLNGCKAGLARTGG